MALRVRSSVALTALSLLWGCSLLFGLPAVGDQPADASLLDAGRETPSDAGLVDEVAPSDTGVDASKRCVFQPGRFCEDFENDAGLGCSLVSDPGTSATVLTGNADSPLRYLSLSFSAQSGNKAAYCATPNGSLNDPSKYRVAMALRFDAQLSTGARVMSFYPNADESVRLILVSNGARVQALIDAALVDGGGRYFEPPELAAPLGPYGLWHTVSIDVDVTLKKLTLSVDGVARPSADFSDVRLVTPTNPFVRFGSDYSPELVKENAILLDSLVLEPR